MNSALYVTAFADIGRGQWDDICSRRSSAEYLDHFNVLSELVVRHGKRLVAFTDEQVSSNLPWVSVHSYQQESTFFHTFLDEERRVMRSSSYVSLVSHRAHHPEHHIPEYNVVNHNKMVFLKRARCLHPCYATFVWIDFHQMRHVAERETFTQITDYTFLPSNQVTVCSSQHVFSLFATREQIIRTNEDHIQGSVLVVPRDRVDELYDEYVGQLVDNYASDVTDDDQGIHRMIFCKHPELYNIVYSNAFGNAFGSLSDQGRFSDVGCEVVSDNKGLFVYMRRLCGDDDDIDDDTWTLMCDMWAKKIARVGDVVDVIGAVTLQWYAAMTLLLSNISVRVRVPVCVATENCFAYLRHYFGKRLQRRDMECVTCPLYFASSDAEYVFVRWEEAMGTEMKHRNCRSIRNKFHVYYTMHGNEENAHLQVLHDLRANLDSVSQATTELCDIMTQEGSDKGNGWHRYTVIYDALFKPLRHKQVALFEFGLGSTNPDIPSNMGVNGRPGASLFGWDRFFTHPDALLWGADIDADIRLDSPSKPRVKSFVTDQREASMVRGMWEQLPSPPSRWDIIIDDGLHELHANKTTIENSFDELKPGGMYVIEDVMRDAIPEYERHIVRNFKEREDVVFCEIFDIPNRQNHVDNALLIIVKG